MTLEARSRRGWREVSLDLPPPRVGETDLLQLRGLTAGSSVLVGGLLRHAGADGRLTLRWADEPELAGHVGLLELTVDGHVAGEIDVVPEKMSEAAWRYLRADLEEVWRGLLFESSGQSRLQAGLPPAADLWSTIEEPVRSIILEPRRQLQPATVMVRPARARRPVPGARSIIGWRTGTWIRDRRSVATPHTTENALVWRTLARLERLAERQGDDDTASAIGRLLEVAPFGADKVSPGVPWGMRSDPRYRRVLAVHRMLDRPELVPTEGPGELRLGVRGLSRLYEYWVFLQVLVAARLRYGTPASGFSQLAVRTGAGLRLELRAGTEVTFSGDVHVVFEPVVQANSSGWRGIEYVPHPDPQRQQVVATPDVLVFRASSSPWITVIDAKYVARGWIETQASRMHEKYARMRVGGVPAVRHVIAAHPHAGYSALWAGYGHLPFVPGEPVPALPLPAAGRP